MNSKSKKIQTADACVHAAFFMDGLCNAGLQKALEASKQGCVELVCTMTAHVNFLQELLAAVNQHNPNVEFPGVFDYEVSSEFGRYFGVYVIEHGEEPPTNEAEAMLMKEVLNFFSQAMSKDESDYLGVILEDLLLSRT